MRLLSAFAVSIGLLLAVPAQAQAPAAPPEPAPQAVEQLRHVIGLWDVETDFVGPDGEITQSFVGQYRFGWVVTDRVVSGMSTIPTLNQASGILFFVRPARNEIEMSSVGPDGHLWRMIGPDTSETRTTPNTEMADGSTIMLRFTRYAVQPDRFQSRMEVSTDGGASWRVGNEQRFVRVAQN